ncbi:hypothetical protein COCON_G00156370 [Conger conger]|uniref:Uncharacterized protein n=1 Tax=Conger conger TaxID=82655 RepID=A0A9Q1D9U5_CONCO|nr:shootin-1-like isoform X2 [Conger conger]KAJ8263180.1 hypothetical protein COCON_G00156370 [Conger conger]
MSGKLWRFSCCQKRKDRGQHLSKTKQKGKEINVQSLQQRTDGIDIAHVNDFQSGELPERTIKEFLSSTQVEQIQKTVIEDQGDYAHDQNVSIGVTLSGFQQKGCVDEVGGSVVPLSKRERDNRLTRKQLEVVLREKHELQAQVLQANQDVRNLRHEIAVLQKRLQVAENRLPNLPPLCPPPPPPLPPPAQPHVNPLRALLTVIQKRRSAKDPNICLLQDAGPLPESPEDADTTYNHQCPGMNQVLEMIRGGVSLRHVIQVHKVGVRAREHCSEPGGSWMVPELQKILKKRKVSADKHVSDGSCDGSMEEDPAACGLSPPTLGTSPGASTQTPPLQDSFTQDTRGPSCEVDEGPGDGDAASTTSTLPLACPLDQGQVDSPNASPCPDGPALDTSSGQPWVEGHADLRTSSEGQALTADHRVAVDPTLQSNSSPNLTDESAVVRDGGERVTLQAQRSTSLEAVQSRLSCQSFGSVDFGKGSPDVPEDAHRPFSLLHDMLKPPIASHEEQAHAVIANDVTHVLISEALGESVDGPELDGPLP